MQRPYRVSLERRDSSHFSCLLVFICNFMSVRNIPPLRGDSVSPVYRVSLKLLINKETTKACEIFLTLSKIPWLEKIIWVIWVLRRTIAATDVSTTCAEAIFTVEMASAQVVEMPVANNSPSKESNHPDDLFQSRHVTAGFKSFPFFWKSFLEYEVIFSSQLRLRWRLRR